MKKIVKLINILIIFIVIASCNSSASEKKNIPNVKSENFDWLLGKWERLNEESGKKTFENWEKINLNEYYGIGFTLKDGDTIKQERIRIVRNNEKWDLQVKVPEENDTIIFPMIELKENEFMCKNNSINFPKKIKYWIKGERMFALVSGDSLNINFEFKRKE